MILSSKNTNKTTITQTNNSQFLSSSSSNNNNNKKVNNNLNIPSNQGKFEDPASLGLSLSQRINFQNEFDLVDINTDDILSKNM